LRGLMAAGSLATPAVREGLHHPEPAVRVGCCQVLDHFMDEAALPELIENLGHENETVRAWAMHALACDRCKEGICRPGEDQVLPAAICRTRRPASSGPVSIGVPMCCAHLSTHET